MNFSNQEFNKLGIHDKNLYKILGNNNFKLNFLGLSLFLRDKNKLEKPFKTGCRCSGWHIKRHNLR